MMANRAQECRQKAEQCEHAATVATDLEAQRARIAISPSSGVKWRLTLRRKSRESPRSAPKDIAAPFQAIHVTMKDNKWWLVMNATKEALKTAPGYKYDKTSTTWVSDKS